MPDPEETREHFMSRLHVLDHPLAAHHLARLRDRATPPAEFRRLLGRLTGLLGWEATRDLPTAETKVRTPLTEGAGRRLDASVAIVPILRAGLAMTEPLLEMIPEAEVRHVGAYRDEASLRPVAYYQKLPEEHTPGVAIIADPMLATGGTAAYAVGLLRERGVASIKLLSIIAAPEGIEHVHGRHPETEIYVCAVDSHLDERGFIVPGLGDAGDRAFNT